jgi:L-asparaginase
MKRVLLLHTGGTLGMTGTPLHPDAYGSRLLEAVPELVKLADVRIHIACNLDSSDVGPAIWADLARTIAAHRDQVDGFVVVHGTDTMAYTAGALAFTLEGLGKPVILTGAQRPLAALRTDARRNLVDAVELATCDVPEVGVCFDGLLLRGCRAVKNDARSYRAFASPGVPPLATMGTDVDVAGHVRRRVPSVELTAPVFDPFVDVVYVTPGLRADAVSRRLDDPELRGVVLAAFGVGTVPTKSGPVAPILSRAVDRGIDVLVVTQWGGRVDLALYENSRGLADAGCLSGGMMHVEAALPKLMHALARFPSRDERRQYLERDVAGEMR